MGSGAKRRGGFLRSPVSGEFGRGCFEDLITVSIGSAAKRRGAEASFFGGEDWRLDLEDCSIGSTANLRGGCDMLNAYGHYARVVQDRTVIRSMVM